MNLFFVEFVYVCVHVCARVHALSRQNGQHVVMSKQNGHHMDKSFMDFKAFVITKVKTDAGVLVPQKCIGGEGNFFPNM